MKRAHSYQKNMWNIVIWTYWRISPWQKSSQWRITKSNIPSKLHSEMYTSTLSGDISLILNTAVLTTLLNCQTSSPITLIGNDGTVLILVTDQLKHATITLEAKSPFKKNLPDYSHFHQTHSQPDMRPGLRDIAWKWESGGHKRLL